VDERGLYRPAAYPSMVAYCIGELRFTEEAARKRIHAARTARRFPALLPAVADGRLSLSAVVTLAPRLSPENVAELVAAAAHRSRFELDRLLAERFPRLDVPTQVVPLGPVVSGQAPEHAGAGPAGGASRGSGWSTTTWCRWRRAARATVEGVRLLCRAHNQYEPERTYGAGSMERKREEVRREREKQREAARRAAEARRAEQERRRERDRAEAAGKREAARATKAAESDPGTSVIPWLRSLGVQPDQARRAAEAVAHMVDAPLEDRVKVALGFHANVRFPSLLHGLGGAAGGAVTAGGGTAGGGIAGAGVVPS
jgi:hypothetical protein